MPYIDMHLFLQVSIFAAIAKTEEYDIILLYRKE